MAIIDVTFQDDFRRAINDGDVINLWNDIDIVYPFPRIKARNVTLNGRGHILRGLRNPLFDSGADYILSPTVSNLTICVEYNRDDTGDGASWGGLFRAADGAKVTNCSVMAKIHTVNDSVGGIAGILRNSTVERCSVRGNLESDYFAGGIAASIYDCRITQCHNEATVTAAQAIAGGITGNAASYSIIEECANYKNAEINALFVAGGVAGVIYDGVIVRCCRNRADIKGLEILGGIVGSDDGLYDSGTIIRNLNTGNVVGESILGGIVGRILGDALIADNSNCGVISGTEEFVGGITGLVELVSQTAELKNNRVRCGAISGRRDVHRIVGYGGAGLAMTGNMADPGIKITGSNTADSQVYAGESVRADDPQSGGWLLHGMSCKRQCPSGACWDGETRCDPAQGRYCCPA
jgi:hypothetical protein